MLKLLKQLTLLDQTMLTIMGTHLSIRNQSIRTVNHQIIDPSNPVLDVAVHNMDHLNTTLSAQIGVRNGNTVML